MIWRGQRPIRAERLGDALLSTPFLGTIIALLTWPIASPIPSTGPDASWVAGLYMGLQEHLQFGTQFIFAYGPLGFLEQPVLYDGELWMVAFLYRGVVYIALGVGLLWATRRAMPLIAAAAIVYTLLVIGYLDGAAVLVTFIVCIAALSDDPPARAPILIAVGGGLLAAVELLGKLNFGLTILVLCLITLFGLPERRRYVSAFVGILLASLAILWLAADQSLANLPDFASNSIQILSGYSSAMATNISDVSWQRPYAIAAMALLLAAAWFATVRDPLARRISTIGVVVAFSFLNFKQAFVRQGLGNTSDYFPMMLGAALALLWRLPRRVPRLPAYAPACALIVPLAILAIAALPRPSFWASLDPGDHVEYLRQDLRAFTSPEDRRNLEAEGRRWMTSVYRVDPKTLRMIRGRAVDVEPWEIGTAWAYRLDWRPLPVIQGYQAYTPVLDSVNAEAFSGSAAPTAILRQNTREFSGTIDPSIDHRNIAWDPPAVALAMLCHYHAVRTTRRWQVLYPAGDRCGPSYRIGRVHSETGHTITVPSPPPGGIVFARVHGLGVGGLERLRTLLYRARQRTATVNGVTRWRVVPQTAADGLIVRSDPKVDFPTPFALAPQARSISFDVAGTAARPIEVAFFAQLVKPNAG